MPNSEDEESYTVTATLTYVEEMDMEAMSKEEAEERLSFFIEDDINQGLIPADAFDIEVEAEEMEE